MSGQAGSRGKRVSYAVLFGAIALGAVSLAAWKKGSIAEANAAAASMPEPVEVVTAAEARAGQHRQSTTSIGTVLALRSITLRNEVAGTVRDVMLVPGAIVEAGTVLVALDVSVEELEQARAQRQVALAQTARTQAIIDRKVIRAPFRARVGIADVHPGQYLNDGTQLTTLQGVDDAEHVDFTVSQQVAAGLRQGERVEVVTADGASLPASIVAIDARVDPATRNALVRARVAGAGRAVQPGASVRVVVPVGPESPAVLVPVSALRKAPTGDHVFVVTADEQGAARAHARPVVAGPMVGDEIVILSGLEVGEQVASSGSFKLREGVKVQVAGAQQAAEVAP